MEIFAALDTSRAIFKASKLAMVNSPKLTLRERLRTHKVFTKDQCFYLKTLSHWDATSSRWVLRIDSLNCRELSRNCRETFAWYRKVLACIANSSRTGRQSFKYVILFCATKIIAKPSPSHRICREPVANQSPTLRRRSQTHRKEVSAIYTMRQISDINKTISGLNCAK